MTLARSSVLALALLGLPAALPAQTLSGRVFDGLSGQPVSEARVTALNAAGEPVGVAISDSTGVFATRLPEAGTYWLSVRATGYDSVTVDSVNVGVRESVRIELRLGPRPLDVEGVRVVARRVERPGLEDFYERLDRHEKTGRGVVLDRDDLERYAGASGATALARASLQIQELSRPGGGIIMKRLAHVPPWCTPAVFLDGMLVDAFTLQSLPASTLAGVEMYRGILEVPAQYSWAPDSQCGVILAWTRMQGRKGVEGIVRPFRFGAYLTGVATGDQSLELGLGNVGGEIEMGIARSLVAWVELGVLPERPPDCTTFLGASCTERPRGWSAVLGASLFPTGEDLWLAPYGGLGIGMDVRSGTREWVRLFRLGVEAAIGFSRVRLEARGGSQGWGLGLGVMF